MKRKLFLILGLLLAGTVTSISYAQVTATSGTTIAAVGVSGQFAVVSTRAEAAADSVVLKYNVDPAWSPSTDATGNITTPGDLYYIDTGTYQGDLFVTLSLTNPTELTKSYTYLNLLINVYKRQGVDGWVAVEGSTTYLTLTNGYVSFLIPGASEFDITIDGGNFYAIGNGTNGSLSPTFFVDVRQR